MPWRQPSSCLCVIWLPERNNALLLASVTGLLLQGYTQYGGLRPFGVSLLYGGWDSILGFQLYQVPGHCGRCCCGCSTCLNARARQRDARRLVLMRHNFPRAQSNPSGNYDGWKATAIGANHQSADNILKQDYKDDITLAEAVKLVVKVRN